MLISDLVTPAAVIASLKATSKKQALQELARRASELTGEPERTIFDVLLERERLGTTGVGDGVAIPHGKLANLPRLFGLFARLDRPIDFESIDEQPVDLIFLLLAPGGAGADHLKALARVSRLLRDRATRERRSTRCSSNTTPRRRDAAPGQWTLTGINPFCRIVATATSCESSAATASPSAVWISNTSSPSRRIRFT